MNNDERATAVVVGAAVQEAILDSYGKCGAEGPGAVHVTITHQNQQLPQPLAPYDFRKGLTHNLESVDAVADVLLRHGRSDYSIVYYNDDNISAILNKTVVDRPYDEVLYPLVYSPQALAWKKIFGQELNQKDLIKFLKSREPGEIGDIESLIVAAQKVKGNFKVVSETTYVDSNNMGFVYKVEDQAGKTLDEGTMNLPSKLDLAIPLLKESPHLIELSLELELTKPIDGKLPFFVISCPRWDTFWRQAVELAVEDLKELLPGYLIVAGKGYDRG